MTSVSNSNASIHAMPNTWLSAAPNQLAGNHMTDIKQARSVALKQVLERGLPTVKNEGWRYTSLRSLLAQNFICTPSDDVLTVNEEAHTAIETALQPALETYRVVLINGRYAPQWSYLENLPSGVQIDSLNAVLNQSPARLAAVFTQIADTAHYPFTALNIASCDDGLVILIDDGVTLERPIELLHVSTGSLNQSVTPPMMHPHHCIQLGTGAQAQLIERFVSIENAGVYCTNAVLEIALSPRAVLRHARLQLESLNAFHITGLHLQQAIGSDYSGINIGIGGAWSRTDLITRFIGEQAHCEQRGLYLVGDQQIMDYHLDIAHQVPNCSSQEQFKGILYGQGKAVFDGRILVAANAQQTDANMTNNNLLLSRNAEIDTKPQLEIYADDVKCSHGTTVGQLDPDMLFYLQSRGLTRSQARQMLSLGFAADVLTTLAPEQLHEQVINQIERRLETATF
ncbi:Fe-S cluster assembly protein SufD [Thiospirillum jenense]|uniref:Fe-S cluster assembly protein SufD n=2 Tax=Thiospirillum jenense TaxID=1653858 RepID=A0A839HDH0_9GAMM|nr:Fe-S cluster assembly protein SufD [Thiospirillum jenense]